MNGTPTIIGAPYDASSSYRRGAALAPPRIRAALASEAGNPWSENVVDLSRAGRLDDDGDIPLPPDGTARELIEAHIGHLLASGRRPLVLGGDHSITYPVLRALRPRSPRLSLLHLDAHPDLYDSFGGDRFSHACPFARVMEEGLVDQLVQIGIRAMTGPQQEQASRFNVEVVDMRSWSAGQRFELAAPVYISIDLDVLDPAFAPGVAHREPGGFSVRELLAVLASISTPIVGCDVVEYNPLLDVSDLTAAVSAKIVRESASAMLRNPLSSNGLPARGKP